MFAKVAKHWATCGRFQTNTDRLLYVYGRVLRRIRRGLPGRNAVVRVRLQNHQKAFYLRLSSTDWLVLEEIFHQGEYTFVERHVKNARWIVDLGANAGFSVRYWHALYPAAWVVAVEPDPANCDTCTKNNSAAALSGQVRLVRAAVGPHSGRAQLMQDGGEWGYQVRPGRAEGGISVEMCTMRQLLDEHAPGHAIDLLKCDIEGAERDLFANCVGWIDRVKSMVIELHPPYEITGLMEDLAQAGADFTLLEVSTKKACPVAFLQRSEPPRSMGERTIKEGPTAFRR